MVTQDPSACSQSGAANALNLLLADPLAGTPEPRTR